MIMLERTHKKFLQSIVTELEKLDKEQFEVLTSMLKKIYGKNSELAGEVSNLFEINEQLSYLIGQIISRTI